MSRILAIDYGKKRVGIAVTDELQIIAGPLTTVNSHDIIAFLKDYFSKEHVELIVVGKPTQMSGEDSESMVYVTAFLKNLKKQFPDYPVELVDERFTSKNASLAIAQAGLKKKVREDKALIDKVSATIILQHFLTARDFRRTL